MLAGAVASAVVLFSFAGISGWGPADKLFGSGSVRRPLFYLLARMVAFIDYRPRRRTILARLSRLC